MKNLLVYYASILLPIPLLVWGIYNKNATCFFILLVCYAIYRSFTDGQRLLEKKLIDKSDFWKAFIPLWTALFFKELYFEK